MGPWSKEKKEAFERLSKRIANECYSCEEKAVYTQPHKDTGRLVNACKKHFTMDLSS